jgi:hypothetical protein
LLKLLVIDPNEALPIQHLHDAGEVRQHFTGNGMMVFFNDPLA